MGCRLSGPPVARDPEAPASIVSEPVARGVVQVPADGQPIVLLGEQTIGGYTCIATVLACDLWRLGQARPGNRIGFVRTTLDQAYAVHREWAGFLAATGRALAGP
jgi:allophanate hydrolase subunit 2